MKKDFFFIFKIYIIIFAASFSGIMLIYGSRIGSEYGLSAAGLALRQFFYLTAGLIIMDLIRRTDRSYFIKYAPFVYCAALILLAGVLLFGAKINGMRGWYVLAGISLQPSELFKFIYILFIAGNYLKYENKEKAFCINAAWSLPWIGAILLQPDYGTAMLYGLTFALISFLAGVKLYILAILPLGAILSLLYFINSKEYGFKRIYGFFSENADVFGTAWHWKQFQLTIARGSWWGNRLGHAFWSNNYLPFAYNDSAFAALHEFLGAVGAITILSLFFVLFYLFLRQAKNNKYELIIISGAAAILMHVLLHCSVNCALIPTTGLNMPLISYGGSSLAGTLLLIGMMLSFARSNSDQQ